MTWREEVTRSVDAIARKAMLPAVWMGIRGVVHKQIAMTPDAKLRELVEEIHAASARLREVGKQ